ncbi:MAG: hypothetical protein HYV68_01805 [Candidatus Taylorbacteria bacterium]|nr:hypothetical protein [Candidatus Taylorbacteria bacterium]
MFYVATAALIIVCALLSVALYYIAKIAKHLSRISERAREESRRLEESIQPMHSIINTVTSLILGFMRLRRRDSDYK